MSLLLTGTELSLCSWILFISKAMVRSGGTHVFFKMVMFWASQILYTKRTGNASYKPTTSSCHQDLVCSSSVLVGISCVPLFESTLVTPFHTLHAYGHKENKWELISSFILHNEQIPGPSKLLFFNISKDNSLLGSSNHIVRMVFCGI